MKWKVLESEYLFKKEWLTVRKDKCEMPGGKIVPEFYINEYPDWVNALALTKEGKILMVKQYRHGIGEVSIELPGGVVDEGENQRDAMIRELMEETGYTFEKLEFLAKVSANPSTTNNYTHLYLATGGTKTGDQQLDNLEQLEVLEITIDELKSLVRENRIVQSLHLNCIFYALLKIDEIRF